MHGTIAGHSLASPRHSTASHSKKSSFRCLPRLKSIVRECVCADFADRPLGEVMDFWRAAIATGATLRKTLGKLDNRVLFFLFSRKLSTFPLACHAHARTAGKERFEKLRLAEEGTAATRTLMRSTTGAERPAEPDRSSPTSAF